VDKQDQIRRQSLATDWSAVLAPEATVDLFGMETLEQARQAFAAKYPKRFTLAEVMSRPMTVFTDRARVTKPRDLQIGPGHPPHKRGSFAELPAVSFIW